MNLVHEYRIVNTIVEMGFSHCHLTHFRPRRISHATQLKLGNPQGIHLSPPPLLNSLFAMSLSIDLTTHGRQLQQVYDKIISGSSDTSWAVFAYDKGASNELKVQSTGSTTLSLPRLIVGGELDEIVEEFSDGRVSYGCTRSLPLYAWERH